MYVQRPCGSASLLSSGGQRIERAGPERCLYGSGVEWGESLPSEAVLPSFSLRVDMSRQLILLTGRSINILKKSLQDVNRRPGAEPPACPNNVTFYHSNSSVFVILLVHDEDILFSFMFFFFFLKMLWPTACAVCFHSRGKYMQSFAFYFSSCVCQKP